MVTSKYRRLSSWGVAEMPCTLVVIGSVLTKMVNHMRTHGSFIRRSVSLIMRLGRAMTGRGVESYELWIGQNDQGQGKESYRCALYVGYVELCNVCAAITVTRWLDV